MAETSIITLTTTYQEIAVSGAWSAIQVVGSGAAEIYLGDTPGTNQGFVLKNLDGMTPTSWADAKVNARIKNGAPQIAVLA